MGAKVFPWVKRILGWAFLGFIAYFIPSVIITVNAWKEVAEYAILPFWVTVIAFPFSLVFGIAGGLLGWKLSNKNVIGVIGSILGGILAPVLVYLSFRANPHEALKLIDKIFTPVLERILEMFSD